jgi:hypothetical protein
VYSFHPFKVGEQRVPPLPPLLVAPLLCVLGKLICSSPHCPPACFLVVGLRRQFLACRLPPLPDRLASVTGGDPCCLFFMLGHHRGIGDQLPNFHHHAPPPSGTLVTLPVTVP